MSGAGDHLLCSPVGRYWGIVRIIFVACLSTFFYTNSIAAEKIKLGGTGLKFACAAGDVTSQSGIVWFRTKKEGSLFVQYSTDPKLNTSSSLQPVNTTKKTDFTVQLTLSGLKPGTTYYYRGVVKGNKPGPICKFVTAPKPDEIADVLFAFGGDTREKYKPFRIMGAIRAKQPDFFLFLGDTIYGDRDDGITNTRGYWSKYVTNRKDKDTQRLFSETSLYVIWDDHEVENNFDSSNPLMPIGRSAFFDYWPITRNQEESGRLYRSFRWGKAVELFILDTRQYRDVGKGTILGEKQKKWFLKALSSSTADFKFVATTVPISSGHKDKWGGFMLDRFEVLEYIVGNEIPGVIFLAADVHYAAVSSIPEGGDLREVIVGPLGTKLKDKKKMKSRFEFLHYKSYNYGLVRVNAKAAPPYVEIEILDRKNKLLYKTRFHSTSP